MSAKISKEEARIKASGVNKAMQEGVAPSEFTSRVICKKCGKDIEFTLGSELFLKCPRCQNRVERNLADENKGAKKIIKYDILRRSKKYLLQFGFVLTLLVLAYNTVGFFCGLFDDGKWWLALLSLPFVAIAYVFVRITYKKSASKKYRVFSFITFGLVALTAAVVVVTAVPLFSEKLMGLYDKQ